MQIVKSKGKLLFFFHVKNNEGRKSVESTSKFLKPSRKKRDKLIKAMADSENKPPFQGKKVCTVINYFIS